MRALLALMLLALPALGAELEGPIAVMPFKNLNEDPSLEWLRAGMSETMISDLKKSGKVAVVERAQIDRALAEIALQAQGVSEDATAARVGRMTGAKTIVVGSFQEFAKQLRINARFVGVESGVVAGAAKTTGPVGNVFILQDEIISRLLGVEPKSAAKARPRKTGEKTVKAYKLYAMALTTANDADKVNYLTQSVSADPDFTYALDDLKALRERLGQLEQRSDKALLENAASVQDALDDPGKTDAERSLQAVMTMGKLMAGNHWLRVQRMASKVIEAHIPPANGMDATEIGYYYRFLSEYSLKQTDQALKSGESFLTRYPNSMYASGAQSQMRQLIEQKEEQMKDADKVDAALAEIAKERAEKREQLKAKPDLLAMLERNLDFRECSELLTLRRYQRAIETCLAFARNQEHATLAKGQEDLPFMARWFAARAYSELGDFAQGRALARTLEKESPEQAKRFAVEAIERTWPRD